MNDETKRPDPPKLRSLDLGLPPGALEGVVCDIDDPDCEAPAPPADSPREASSSVGSPRPAQER